MHADLSQACHVNHASLITSYFSQPCMTLDQAISHKHLADHPPTLKHEARKSGEACRDRRPEDQGLQSQTVGWTSSAERFR